MVLPFLPVDHYLKTTATTQWTWSVRHNVLSKEEKTLQRAARDFTAARFFPLYWSLLNLQWRLWTWLLYKADLPDVISVHSKRAGRQTQSPANHFIWTNLCLLTSSKRLQTSVISLTPCVDGYREDAEHFHESDDYLITDRALNTTGSIDSSMPAAVSTN